MEKTIYALATPIGGAIAIIRMSGSRSLSILQNIFTGVISHSKLSHGKLVDGDTPIDDIMAVYFESPRSYTGEDMAELHIHASVAVAKEVMGLLSKHGAVPAEAGEFSRRAFMNGKLKLSEAEAIMDLISSTAKRSASSAMLQLSGKLTAEIRTIQNKITDILSEINAIIDYPDEMDDADLTPQIKDVCSDVNKLLEHGMNARHIREGFSIAIVGKPNVGKSSLLNALIAEDKAIVSGIAGTTRDVIEADTSMEGLPVHLYDTAGIRDTVDEVESIGIERAKYIMTNADMVYVAIDLSGKLETEDEDILLKTENMNRIIVLCKSDISNGSFTYKSSSETVTVSTVTGEGIEELKRLTAAYICPDDESGILTNMRHIQALSDAKSSLYDAACAVESDCMAQDLHSALHSLGLITGDAVDENMLARIFERFCVGK